MIQDQGFREIGIYYLSSGGRLGTTLLARYPEGHEEHGTGELLKISFAVIGYAPISANAKGL